MKAKLFAFLACLSPLSNAEIRPLQTGNDLLFNITEAKKGDNFASTYIKGYLRGVSDVQVIIGSLCPPDGVDMTQYTDIVESYLQKNPLTRNESAVTLSIIALGQAFPCKKKPT